LPEGDQEARAHPETKARAMSEGKHNSKRRIDRAELFQRSIVEHPGAEQ
jgi:hypothetical protein